MSCSLNTKGQVCHAPIIRESDKGSSQSSVAILGDLGKQGNHAACGKCLQLDPAQAFQTVSVSKHTHLVLELAKSHAIDCVQDNSGLQNPCQKKFHAQNCRKCLGTNKVRELLCFYF